MALTYKTISLMRIQGLIASTDITKRYRSATNTFDARFEANFVQRIKGDQNRILVQ